MHSRTTRDEDQQGTDRWPGGFGALYEQHFVRLVKVARLIVKRQDVAEEIVQDSFIALADHWSNVRTPGAYVRRSVVNRCYSYVARREREDAYLSTQRPAVVPPPRVNEIWEGLDRLSPKRRVALVLRYYEDLDDASIAEILGCRPATVRSLIHRGLHQLRRQVR